MSKTMQQIKFSLLIAFMLTCAVSSAQDSYTIAKGYSVVIKGTSNLHDWDESVGIVTGDGKITMNNDGTFDLDDINIKMDVHSIKSDMGGAMNNNTYKALKADTYPQITFILTAPVKNIKSDPGATTISAKGNMTIAGVTKPIIMQVIVNMPQKGIMEFSGSQVIKMTDYGVKPPTALFGALKTGDTITINFKTDFALNN